MDLRSCNLKSQILQKMNQKLSGLKLELGLPVCWKFYRCVATRCFGTSSSSQVRWIICDFICTLVTDKMHRLGTGEQGSYNLMNSGTMRVCNLVLASTQCRECAVSNPKISRHCPPLTRMTTITNALSTHRRLANRCSGLMFQRENVCPTNPNTDTSWKGRCSKGCTCFCVLVLGHDHRIWSATNGEGNDVRWLEHGEQYVGNTYFIFVCACMPFCHLKQIGR